MLCLTRHGPRPVHLARDPGPLSPVVVRRVPGPEPGTYVLVLGAPPAGQVQIGSLGGMSLSGGWLAYVGSALGPGGLRARVGRHLSGDGTLHWHIDYLLRAVDVTEVWYSVGERRREEEWAASLRSAPGAALPMRGFGSSDCGCPGHLMAFEERPRLVDFRRWLLQHGLDAGSVTGIPSASARMHG